MHILRKIESHKMIGILRGYGTQEAVEIVGKLIEHDFTVIEVALNSPDAKNTLKVLKSVYSDQITLGAGTVLTVEDAQECVEIGAEFLLSPVYEEDVLNFSRNNGILYIPGCYTPTEIYRAYKSGAEMIKVFPAGGLGPSYIKDVLAPMQNLSLLPTGGVDAENINAFFKAGATAVGLSSALVPSGRDVNDEMLTELGERVDILKEELSE